MSDYDDHLSWFEAPKGRVHSLVFAHVDALDRVQGYIHASNIAYAQLYSNRREPGLGGSGRGPIRDGEDGSVTENVIQSVIDTATSLIGKTRPKVTVLTDGADWSLQRMAKQVEKYIWGVFQSTDVFEKMGLIFRDACVFGDGVIQVFTRNGQICTERVLIDEMTIDEQEVPAGGLPRQVHRTRYVSRAVLRAQYTKGKTPAEAKLIRKAIQDSTGRRRNEAATSSIDADMVRVIESYYLSPGPGVPGRHTICVEQADLFDEVWSNDWYPYVFVKWSPPLTGFYGQGLAEALLGFQIRINELNDFINRCQDLIAVPRIFVDAGSKMMKIQINNEVGAMIPYVGKPPVFMTPQAVSAEVYRYKETLKAAAFEFAGISKMAAQATRPEGIEAAVALRELSDNQSQRFSIQQQRLEASFMQVGRLIIEMAKKLGESAPKMFMTAGMVEEIEWPAVDFDKLRFVLHVSPSSIMSMTPAGRIQTVIELAQYGVMLPQATLLRLLDGMDLGLEMSRETAARDYAEWVISQAIAGKYIPPGPFEDLELSTQTITDALLDLVPRKAPEKILELLRRRIKAGTDQLKKARAAQAADPMAAMGMGPAPMPPMPAQALASSALPGIAYAPQ